MSLATVAAPDARPHILPGLSAEVPARRQAGSTQPSVWRRISFWPLEFIRLVAAVYILPLAILAIVIPVGLALKGVLLGAAWVLRTLW